LAGFVLNTNRSLGEYCGWRQSLGLPWSTKSKLMNNINKSKLGQRFNSGLGVDRCDGLTTELFKAEAIFMGLRSRVLHSEEPKLRARVIDVA
jgi:hypothetical protein